MIAFRDLKLGDTFLDRGKYVKISDNQAMSLDYSIERYYSDDEVEQVTDPNDRIFIIEGWSVGV